ncbi:DUF3046 domain-containing protein [Leucobacter celer]|uniref:DUF3046 domain-containing protein n=1 Tax=Leucobacter celer TaxID=668625 RepID=UPI0006A78D40|nr:DUF3046 domain-containing protein [Leucobacter celer]
MRLSEFRRACVAEFGEDYAGVLLRDHWLAALGGTANEALERGIAARAVWEALCVDLGVPEQRRYGRGLRDPQN